MFSSCHLSVRCNFVGVSIWRQLGALIGAGIPAGQCCQEQEESPQQDTKATEVESSVVLLRPVVKPAWGWDKREAHQ